MAAGYRREHQVEHRGELAVRGGIVDVFPSTADAPVRIDLWGDEVDRLTTFDVGDQRSTDALDAVEIFGCRELVPVAEVRARAAALGVPRAVGARPVGAAGRGAGLRRDGVVAAVAAPGRGVCSPTCLARRRRWCWSSRGGCATGRSSSDDEEGALAEALAATWGAGGRRRRRRAVPPPAPALRPLLSRSRAAALSMVPVAEGPDVPAVTVRGFEPVAGDAGRLARQVTSLAEERSSVTLCSATAGGPARLAGVLAEEGVAASGGRHRRRRVPGSGWSPPGRAGFVLRDAKVAVLAESDVTGRRTPHRPARPRARPTDGFFDDLAPGSFVVHRQHGVARYAGVTTRTVGGTARDYLVLEYRGSDRLYLPVDQIEAVTPYAGGESPTLSRMGGADWQRTRARARAAAGEIAEELVDLYRRRLAVAGPRLSARHPLAARARGGLPLSPRPPTSSGPSPT